MKTKEDEIFQYTPYILFKKSFLGEKSLLFSKKFGAFGVKTCGFIKKIGAPLLVGSSLSISDHDRIFGHTFSEKFMENFQSWV